MARRLRRVVDSRVTRQLSGNYRGHVSVDNSESSSSITIYHTCQWYHVRNKTKITRRGQQKEEKIPICEDIHPSGSAYSNTNKDGTPIWGKRHVEGPGVWVSCAFAIITIGASRRFIQAHNFLRCERQRKANSWRSL